MLKDPYVTAKHGLIGLAKVVSKEGAHHGVRANVVCPGFVRTPLVDQQIPEQARALGISEEAVIREVMLKETVDGEFTTVQDVAEAALFLSSFRSNAITGPSALITLIRLMREGRGGSPIHLLRETVKWLKIWLDHAQIGEGPIFHPRIGRDQIGSALRPPCKPRTSRPPSR